MKKLNVVAAVALSAACSMSVWAKDVATDSLVNNYMRSSLYTIILNSETQNNYFEEETKKGENADGLMTIAKGFAKTDEKKAANDTNEGSIFSLPSKVFAGIAIPNQFNNHNLETRVLDFDALKANITDADMEKYGPKKKKSGFGSFMKAAATQTTGIGANGNVNEEFDKYSPAVLAKFFATENVAPKLIAKWYDYNHEAEQHWGLGTVTDRGSYNFSEADLKEAANDPAKKAKIEQTAFDMIGNTYVMAVNLRFRSYQAIVAEAKALTDAVGSQLGGWGKLASMAAGAVASAAAGDGYTVQAVSSLYRLKWNEDINQKFGVDIFEKNASIDELVNSGLCELEFVGTEKSESNIRQSLFSSKPISQLVERATARAIDQAIIKLQNSHEEFRTVLPVLGGDGNVVYAAIGTKEGLNEKDEYELLEKQEDKNGKTIYKSVGKVKAVKGKIWNNAFGAEEEVLENEKATQADKDALNYGYTEFAGKKGDFRGYYIRLKKKNK